MEHCLVVSYSLTGTSRRLADLLCAQQGWERGEIGETFPRSTGLGGYLRCMLDSWLRRCPAISYQGPDPRSFGIVVLVAPIWMWQLASPMRSFVRQRRDALQRVAVLSVMGSKGAPNAVAEIGQILERAPLLSAAFTMNEVDDGSYAARLQAFGNALNAQNAVQPPVRPL